MKPLRLSLRAFGSYAGEFSVDFARLGRHGVFAITGPTGAGKSTIFDALFYALYDDLPGLREDGHVRSQYADPSTPTWVQLEFEAHGEEWRIQRCPTQSTPRQRGTGPPIERQSTVLLERIGFDGGGITRKSDVSEKILQLVGLTAQQFQQVVLIPQGRFEKVLQAKTTERAQLLQHLFPVEEYRRVTEQLRTAAITRERSFEQANAARTVLVGELERALRDALEKVPADIEVGFDLDALLSDGLQIEDLDAHLVEIERLQRAIAERVDAAGVTAVTVRRGADAASSAVTRFDAWQIDVTKAAGFDAEELADGAEKATLDQARRLAPLETAAREWRSVTEKLATLAPDRARALEKAVAAWPDPLLAGPQSPDYGVAPPSSATATGLLAQQVRHDVEGLDKEVIRYQGVTEKIAAVASMEAAIVRRRDAQATATTEVEVEESAISALLEQIAALGDPVLAVERTTNQIKALTDELVAATRRDRTATALSALQIELAQAATAHERAQRASLATRAAWADGMAGRLAELLEAGGPCPTCGATTHPNPAVLHPDAPDDEALEKVEKASEATLVILRNAERRHAEATGQLEGMPACRDRFALTDELGLCKSQLKEAEEAVIKKTQLETEHAKRTEQLATRREAIDKEDHQLATDEAVLAAQATAVAEEKREFEEAHGNFTSPAPIAESLRSLVSALDVLGVRQGQREEAELRLHNLQPTLAPVLAELGLEDPAGLLELVLTPVVIAGRERRLQERRDCRETVRHRIAEYEQAEHPTTRPDPEPLLAAATVAESRHRDLIGCQAVIVEQAGILNAGPGRLKDADRAAAAARQAFEQAKTLADQCAGLGTGASASRLSLENWVLSDYLRQVLLQANERLAIMTDGRYELRLDEGVTDGRRAWGLDIAAFDANTGQVRPATTFSGGETFMAALSLALGLADVVSGGSNHSIGALFVDEGFGSLDPESLDLTLDVLRSLEDGGRIVGVISHVEDMKLALPNGITIETSPNGSVVQVNYPLV